MTSDRANLVSWVLITLIKDLHIIIGGRRGACTYKMSSTKHRKDIAFPFLKLSCNLVNNEGEIISFVAGLEGVTKVYANIIWDIDIKNIHDFSFREAG